MHTITDMDSSALNDDNARHMTKELFRERRSTLSCTPPSVLVSEALALPNHAVDLI